MSYLGELAAEIVADVSEEGGIITVEDIKEYEAYQEKPLFIDVGQYRIYIPPPPASGVVFAFIVNIMANYHERGQLNVNDTDDFYHKLIEAYKVLLNTLPRENISRWELNGTQRRELKYF